MVFTRITIDPNQMNGEACIRGMRIPVSAVVVMIRQKIDDQKILQYYPDLDDDDLREVEAFIACIDQEKQLTLVQPI